MSNNKVKLYIPRNVYVKLMYWINMSDNEVGGMGSISYEAKENYFWVRDVFLVKQEVSGSTTDLDEISLGQLEHSHHKSKAPGDLNFWWHSHVNMGVFWSTTDKETIEAYSKGGYVVATVFNKKNQFKTAISTLIKTEYGGETSVFMDDIDTEIYDPLPKKDVVAQWEKDFKELVHEKKPVHFNKGKYHEKSKDEPSQPLLTSVKSKREEDKYNYDQTSWAVPGVDSFKNSLTVWRQFDPSIGLEEKDRDFLVMAAATRMHPTTFENVCMGFSQEEWMQLDEIANQFNKANPDFDWSKNYV